MSPGGHNRQVRKTRAALLDAFGELVLARRYPDIRIADIIRRADVGRSTFYEHFRNKDDILRQSLTGVLAHLADAVEDGCDPERLRFVLDHFRENRPAAHGMLNGPSSPQVVTVLAGLIEERLAALRPSPVGRPPSPWTSPRRRRRRRNSVWCGRG
jgi:AcrR family transcriptional regulator